MGRQTLRFQVKACAFEQSAGAIPFVFISSCPPRPRCVHVHHPPPWPWWCLPVMSGRDENFPRQAKPVGRIVATSGKPAPPRIIPPFGNLERPRRSHPTSMNCYASPYPAADRVVWPAPPRRGGKAPPGRRRPAEDSKPDVEPYPPEPQES